MGINKIITKLCDENVALYDKYAYLRLAFSRGQGHIGILMQMYAKIPEVAIIIKLFKIPLELGIPIAILLILLEFIVITLIGHIDLRNNLMSRDVTLSNKYNPEIQALLRKSIQNVASTDTEDTKRKSE